MPLAMPAADSTPARQVLQASQFANTAQDVGLRDAKGLLSPMHKRPPRLSTNLFLGLDTFSSPEALHQPEDQLPLPPSTKPKTLPPSLIPGRRPTTALSSQESVSSTGSAGFYIGLAMASPPLDSDTDEEDPFYFDRIARPRQPLARPPPPARAVTDSVVYPTPRTGQLARSLIHRASIVPIPPSSSSSSSSSCSSPDRERSRFSIVRTKTEDGDVFVQELRDDEGRRWSLRVPASGLPEDMLRMLEELETLARELTEVIPTIVVTQSAQSIGSRRPTSCTSCTSVKTSAAPPVDSEESSSPAEEDTLNDDGARGSEERRTGFLADRASTDLLHATDPSLPSEPPVPTRFPANPPVQQGSRAIQTSLPNAEVPAATAPDVPAIVPAAIPVDPSLHCIFLPDLTSEILKGTATPASTIERASPLNTSTTATPPKPAPTARQRAATLGSASPRGNAFFAALDASSTSTSPTSTKSRRADIRLKTASLDIRHSNSRPAPTARRFASTSDAVVPPTPTVVPIAHTNGVRLAPYRSVSESAYRASPPSPKRLPALPPLLPPVTEPERKHQRPRGRSLLSLRTRSSKSNLHGAQSANTTPSPPASAPPQVPVYKWTSTDIPGWFPPPPPPPPQQQHKLGLKDFFTRRQANRSASEPLPYHPPPPSAQAGTKARPKSEGVRMHAAPFELDVEVSEREVEREREAFEAMQRQVRRMPSARDLFRKKK